jgi:hypothetical protein
MKEQLLLKGENLMYVLSIRLYYSGGEKPHVETTEWEFLKNAGLALGIPEEAILKEDFIMK